MLTSTCSLYIRDSGVTEAPAPTLVLLSGVKRATPGSEFSVMATLMYVFKHRERYLAMGFNPYTV
jgi:hypothetical protein